MALLSRFISNSRVQLAAAHINGDVLDIGCQSGQLRDAAGANMRSYTGLDMNPEALQKGRKLHPDCAFIEADIDATLLDFHNSFDTIVMLAVIEHVFNLKTLGANLFRALRPNGKVVLTTPTPFGNDIVHALGAKLGLFSKMAADDHIAIFNRKRLEIFAAESGLQLSEYKTFQFGCNQLAILTRREDANAGRGYLPAGTESTAAA